MILVITMILAVLPAAAILYPFFRKTNQYIWQDDEGSELSYLERRWEVASNGIRDAELEHSLGNIEENDYVWLRHEYMQEAMEVIQSMELEVEQENEMIRDIEIQISDVSPDSQDKTNTSVDPSV